MTPKGRKFGRGHFDIAVLNPAFIEENRGDYGLLKGQDWERFRSGLETWCSASPPVALYVAELMFVRDALQWRCHGGRGDATLENCARAVQQDWAKVLAAIEPTDTGFRFAMQADMMVFDSALEREVASELGRRIDPVKLYSASLAHRA